jgi:ABC-type molybdate transport system ATPase subunit
LRSPTLSSAHAIECGPLLKPDVDRAKVIQAIRGLVGEAEVLSSLDGVNGPFILRLLAEAAHERGQAVLVVTHDPRILQFADRVVYIEDGSIVARSSGEIELFRISRSLPSVPSRPSKRIDELP